MASGFTAEERAAMRERAKEAKAAKSREEDLAAVLEKIQGLDEPDRAIAARLHEIVGEVAPQLAPRLWYGSPAYALGPRIVLFFQERAKFKVRYGNLGFSDNSHLDDGEMWPTSYAVLELTPEVEARMRELVARAVR